MLEENLMKRILVMTFAALALIPLARGDDYPKKQARARARATEQAPTTTARTYQNSQRQSVTARNPYFRRVPTNAGAAGNFNRTQWNGTQRNWARENNRFNVSRQNRSNVFVNRGGNRRFAGFAGNYRSFADARQWDWHRRHDRGWWISQGFPLVLYGGGYWYWNSGWWYPAYGYDPYYSNYVYDGPIYGYGNVAPGDVTSEVQQALADQGYYQGPIDGILGPMTRGAIERFQADHGLAATAAIDQPTLASLGLA